MKLLPLNCNNCGAPLEAPASAKFLTCAFCNSRLSITRTGSTYCTEVLETINDRTERIASDVATLRRSDDLARLDREWEAKRATYLASDDNGQMSVPNLLGGIVVALVICIVGLKCLSFIWSEGAKAFIALLGIPIILVGIWLAISTFRDAKEYRQAHDLYHRRRRQLMAGK